MEIIGKPTINPGLFYSVKTSVVAIFSSPLLSLLYPEVFLGQVSNPVYLAAWILLGASTLLIVVASLELGKSLRVGLPAGKTRLKTSGLFAYSRNPIYTAFYPCCLAVGILAPHPVVWGLSLFALLVHHQIILGEEKFLARRFGKEWGKYCRNVGRYV